MMHGFEETAEASAVYAGMLMGVPEKAIDDRIAARAAQNAVRELLPAVSTGDRNADAIMASAGLIYDLSAGMKAAKTAAQARLASGLAIDTASAVGLRDILAEGRRIGMEKAHSVDEIGAMRDDLAGLSKALSPVAAGMGAGLGDGRAAGMLLSRAMELPAFAECSKETRTLLIEGARGLSRLYGDRVLTEGARTMIGADGVAGYFRPERPSDLAAMTPGKPLSLPLRADAVSGLWSRALAGLSPEEILSSYNATRLARDAVDGKDEAAAATRDGLELGRRLLAGQMRSRHLAGSDIEKTDRRALMSSASSALPDWMRADKRAPVRTAELSR